MNPRLVQLIVQWVVMALGVTLATKLVDGISCDSTATLIVVVLLLNFFNAIIKPVLERVWAEANGQPVPAR